MKSSNWPDFSNLKFKGNYINGAFKQPKKPDFEYELRSPANDRDEKFIVKGEYSYDELFSILPKAQKIWQGKAIEARKEAIARVLEQLHSLSAKLAEVISKETGKPLWESAWEVSRSLKLAKAQLNSMDDFIKEKEGVQKFDHLGFASQYRRKVKPRGAILALGHFNEPLANILANFVPALYFGNILVVKANKRSPATAQLIADCVDAASLPAGTFNLLQGGREVARRLVSHLGFDAVFYSGDYEFGKQLRKDSFDHYGKLLAFKTGGKNPIVVLEDADIEAAVRCSLYGAYLTAGQRADSCSRIIIHQSKIEQFLESFHQQAKKFVIGQPFDEQKVPFMGPLIDETALDRYLNFQGIGLREKAECIMRGKRLQFDLEGNYVSPSIYYFKDNEQTLKKGSVFLETEIFGPSVSIQRFDSLEEATRLANFGGYGLVASVFTQNEKTFLEASKQIDVGCLFMNKTTIREEYQSLLVGKHCSALALPAVSSYMDNFYQYLDVLDSADVDTLVQQKIPGLDV